MLVSFSVADIKDPDENFIYPRVRFVYQSIAGQGVAAVWQENPSDHSATRLDREEGVRFTRRRSARQPHILTLADNSVWHIWPRPGSGCGCGGRVSSFTYAQLLDPNLETI